MKSRNNRTLIIVIALAVLLFVYLYVRKRNNKNITPIPPRDNNGKDTNGASDEELFTDDSFPLTHGSGGENVETLQKSILEAGGKLPEFGVDGKYGDETKQALENLGYSTVVTEKVLDDLMADAQANSQNFWDYITNF